jgi:predicted ATPase
MEILEKILGGRWNGPESPIKINFQRNNPKLVVITGPNASGKSVLRKILTNNYKKNLIFLSQEGRCQSGIPRCFIYGDEQEDSTGFNTIKSLLTGIKSAKDGRHLFLDEPEIGCSEEVQAAIGQRIVEELDNLQMVYIVSHSRILVDRLMRREPSHIRLEDDMTLYEWLNRRIEPVVLEDVLAKGYDMHKKISKMTK